MNRHRLLLRTAMVLAGLAMVQPVAWAQGEALFAVLVGGTEINSATGQANQGDLNGFGTATVIVHRPSTTTATVCFGITVRGIDTPNAAHIHRGRAGVNGGIVVPLTAPATGNPGASSGCVNVAVATANNLLNDPTEFYVNLHTNAFPGGALRGNLF